MVTLQAVYGGRNNLPELLLVLIVAGELVQLCLAQALVQACQLDKLASLLIPHVHQLLHSECAHLVHFCELTTILLQ